MNWYRFIKNTRPDVVKCIHKGQRKYKLVVKDLNNGELTKKKLCDACAKADLDNNRVFVSLY